LDAALSVSSTAGSGVGSGSATGYVTGYPPPGCARPAGPGIATGAPVSTGAISVTGAPPVWPPPAAVTTGDRTGLRWPDLSNRAIRAPDAIVPGDPWPTAGPAWPHIRLTTSGPLGPGHSGQGVIVATGDLNVASGFAWRGAILVGGSLRLFGDADLTGAVFVGLAGAAAAADLGDGHVRITYDPCSADLATASLAPFPAALPGTWRGDW
ncbi:MAG: hypothetical protein OEU54_15355, partial [Gemmatimonadota bacterium]|nr:hypothetical protein [Gemmatimonadota bacterium]